MRRQLPPKEIYICFMCFRQKLVINRKKDIKFGDYDSLITKMLTTVIIFCTYINESTLNEIIGTDTRAENWNRKQNACKTRPGTGKKSESVLELEPEPVEIWTRYNSVPCLVSSAPLIV